MKGNIAERLTAIGLHGVVENWGRFAEHATLMEDIVTTENAFEMKKKHQRLLSNSGLSEFAPMSLFNWEWPKAMPRLLVESCLDLQPLKDNRNVIIIGPSGVGKSMIAQNMIMNAIQRGVKAHFISASFLLSTLAKAAAKADPSALQKAFNKYSTIPLLAIDEIGYVSYASTYSDLLFQLISLRHEKVTTVITTNIRLSQWNNVFLNTNSLAPMVDRLVHHSDIIKIDGQSWRTRDLIPLNHQQPQSSQRTPESTDALAP